MYVRPLSAEERVALQAGVRSPDGFRVRRCHVLLASANGQRSGQISRAYGVSAHAVRQAIQAFNQRGLASLERRPPIAKSIKPEIADEQLPALKELMHQSPRTFGKDHSLWTLGLLAEVSFEQGLTNRRLSYETLRQATRRLGAGWKRAKRWISSPDPAYQRKKGP